MGLTLKFLVGDVDTIADAVRNADLDLLDDLAVVQKRADFSMHLIPNDLNSLSLEVGIITRDEPLLLRPYLKPILDEVDHGLLAVDLRWVEYFSRVPLDKADKLAENWFAEMADEYNDPGIVLTDFGRKAVRDLIELCKHSEEENLPVVHYWQQ